VKPPPLVQAFSNLAWLNGRIIQLNRARIPPQPVSHTARRTRSDIGGRQQARNSHRPSQLREGDTSPALLPFGDRTERASECASFIIFPLFASSRGRKKRGGELVAVARQFVVVFYWIAFCLRAAGGRPSRRVHPVYARRGALWHWRFGLRLTGYVDRVRGRRGGRGVGGVEVEFRIARLPPWFYRVRRFPMRHEPLFLWRRKKLDPVRIRRLNFSSGL
jgi:hypothetical protein